MESLMSRPSSNPPPHIQTRAMLAEAIDACIRASSYAETSDNVGLAMAAALLRCDLAEHQAGRYPVPAIIEERPRALLVV